MKEISASLKRDVKDLLGESAHVVTSIFKQGWCTVRGIGDKWKAFAHDVSGAVENLMKPAFLEVGKEAPCPTLEPEEPPIVTVMESEDEHLPVGRRMTLSEADAQINELNEYYFGDPDRPIKVVIDYMMDGQNDRYWLPLQVGTGVPLLEQMQSHVNACLTADGDDVARLFKDAPGPLQAVLHEQFGPQLHADLQKLSTRVIGLFRQHLNIAKLEQQFIVQASAMPELKQNAFRASMNRAIIDLRRATNTSTEIPRPLPSIYPMTESQSNPRRSVRISLQQLKNDVSEPPKGRTSPER